MLVNKVPAHTLRTYAGQICIKICSGFEFLLGHEQASRNLTKTGESCISIFDTTVKVTEE